MHVSNGWLTKKIQTSCFEHIMADIQKVLSYKISVSRTPKQSFLQVVPKCTEKAVKKSECLRF